MYFIGLVAIATFFISGFIGLMLISRILSYYLDIRPMYILICFFAFGVFILGNGVILYLVPTLILYVIFDSLGLFGIYKED